VHHQASGSRAAAQSAEAIAGLTVMPAAVALLAQAPHHAFLKKVFGVYASKGVQHNTHANFDAVGVENENIDAGELLALLKDFLIYPQRLTRDAVVVRHSLSFCHFFTHFFCHVISCICVTI
jgi:hypothetical protein